MDIKKVANKITSKLKSKYESMDNIDLKKGFLNAIPFWIGAFITGLVAVIYTKLFSWAELGTKYIFHQASWLFFIITPLCFFLAWWIVAKYSPYARGSGIPQVTAAIELSNPKHTHKVNQFLSIRTIFVKVLSSLIMIFGGGIIGREGPTIQISASIFKKINDILPDWYPKVSRRIMIITGGAAGLASAFNTPLGGIVFAVEELTKTHFNFLKSALLTGVIIAGLTALYLLGPYLYLGYPKLEGISMWIVLAVIPVSIITGFTASLMGRIILYIIRKKRKMKNKFQKIIYIVISGLIVAALAVLVDSRAFGSGKEIMITTLFTSNKSMEWYIPIVRVVGQIVSFCVGASGGIFAPALSAGASIGAFFAGLFQLTATESNLIILCGMVGFLTGITRSPFTSSILVIEMTNSHVIIFPLMMTALIANIVASYVSKHSFYDHLKDRYINELYEEERKETNENLQPIP